LLAECSQQVTAHQVAQAQSAQTLFHPVEVARVAGATWALTVVRVAEDLPLVLVSQELGLLAELRPLAQVAAEHQRLAQMVRQARVVQALHRQSTEPLRLARVAVVAAEPEPVAQVAQVVVAQVLPITPRALLVLRTRVAAAVVVDTQVILAALVVLVVRVLSLFDTQSRKVYHGF
jgi:hypothetical protein